MPEWLVEKPYQRGRGYLRECSDAVLNLAYRRQAELRTLESANPRYGQTGMELKQAGLDDAAAQLLLSRKRVELEDMMRRKKQASSIFKAPSKC